MLKAIKLSVLLSAFALTACQTISPKEQPPNGFKAIKFTQTVQVRDHALNLYLFEAGSLFVNDRESAQTQLYCGHGSVNNGRIISICIGYAGPNKIIIGPNAGFKEVVRQVPMGAIKQVSIRM
jgi:hypothetical protein